MRVSSYPKILALGHRYLDDLFKDPVIIEEKVDGSQFSFGKDKDHKLFFRSKGAELYPPVTDNLFKEAVEYIESIGDKLQPGWIYRSEVLFRPKHNAIRYARIPRNHIALFDVETKEQTFLNPKEKELEAQRLKIDCVPVFIMDKMITNIDTLKFLLDSNSGFATEQDQMKLEGIVIKNYSRFGKDGKALMGKWVREEYKEVQKSDWKKANPSKLDLLGALVSMYKTEARWDKAVQHLKEAGQLVNEPKDIGKLIIEVQRDVKEECQDEIKQKLFDWAWKKISRGVIGGLPEHYKLKLAESQSFTTDLTDTKESDKLEHA